MALIAPVRLWMIVAVIFKLTSLTKDDLETFKIIESFASQLIWYTEDLGLPK
jgi:hypothetical protein